MLKKLEIQRIAALLGQFGLNARETEIYLHCLQTGPATVQKIANDLKQNRVTVHSAIKQLLDKGFLTETRQGKRRLIAAEDPAILSKLIQKKESELRLMQTDAEQILNLLMKAQAPDASVPTVRFYEGVEGLKKMLEETLEAKDEVLVFTYVDLFSELLDPKYLEDYFRRRASKGIHTRLIFPPGDFAQRVNEKNRQYKIQIRLMPPELKWKSGIFSWNDKIAIQSFTEGKITCTIIENVDIAYFYRHIIYELCWKQSKPISPVHKSGQEFQ